MTGDTTDQPRCSACEEQFADHDRLVDHLTDAHDLYTLVTE